MQLCRLSASSYSNTAPLIWSFLYGLNHGKVELVLDNAPSRSAELLASGRVDTALVPVFAYQEIKDVRLVPDVCIGARQRARSVCLITRGCDLADVRSVALDRSSKTSVALTKIVFREFLGFEPRWQPAEPHVEAMLAVADCALLIGDPALVLSETAARTVEMSLRIFDLAQLWHEHTGHGLVFAMWMTRQPIPVIDLSAARDEGLEHLDEIADLYGPTLGLDSKILREYLSENMSYSIDDSMRRGLELFFELCAKHGLISRTQALIYAV